MGTESEAAEKIRNRGEVVSKKHSNGRFNDDDFVAYIVEQSSPALEYVGGYSGRTKPITVRNRNCGHEYAASYHSVVHKGNYTFCPICKAEETQTRKLMRANQSWEKRNRKIQKHSEKMRQVMFLPCVHCGTLFIPKTTRSVCCSSRCGKAEARKRAGNMNGDDRLHSSNVRDWNISLKDLSIRDNDICWLCGKPVDWTDYTMDGDTFIAGNMYPSIDHVVPLSRGGLHEWGNVKLAHRICNSIKSNRNAFDTLPQKG